ncbi:hypothetical protein [Halobacterium jilantaiense]|uniref:Uncharacterized protein n=1 Tax=Halobacterium jilantaiense TaxID=355548 RepID=A0A1I0P9C3_9EURY|nr:hypothetical protein [Halobacterium jilantaiense]SEW10160.1 hypothetical protein SAMN04487945_1454 [Halobacterium jilantaiense]
MTTNLWDTTETESSSTDATATTTAAPSPTAGEQSPLDAAIEASSWSRADIELALQVVQVALLAIWVYHTYHE